MSHHGDEEERPKGRDGPADDDGLSRPEEILRDSADKEAISDEESVLAYNANAEHEDKEPPGPDRED
jgi:hypothetical protein